MANRTTSSRSSWQPLDRTALLVILVLSAVIGAFVLSGSHTLPQVRDFSWQEKQIGAEDTAFLLTFSRPMNHTSVEDNLRIEPPLPGKVSWAGRRMAYTLETPAPYGTAFKLQLQGARDRFSAPEDTRVQMQPFVGQFRSRDRAFVYLGVEGEENGRLMLYNLTQRQGQALTPANLVVMNFKPYPEGDRVLFSATERTDQEQGILNQKLYTVTTGLHYTSPAVAIAGLADQVSLPSRSPQPAGIVERILDSQDYQNLKFDLSPDGSTIIVQRVSRTNPGDFGLWVVKPGSEPTQLKTEPGGDFLIAPDSQAIAMAQGQGMAILPLESEADPLDYLPQFGMILSFAQDGSAAALVKFNTDPFNPTRSLFTVTNQGQETELLTVDGSILDCQFARSQPLLYCLLTTRIPGDDYLEQPYLTALNLETGQKTDLVKLPVQRDVQMSLAPDGLGILFDQVVNQPGDPLGGGLQSDDGKAIATSRLWFLPLAVDAKNTLQPLPPEELPLPGLNPGWLP